METLTENKKKRRKNQMSEEDWANLVKDNSSETIIEKLNTWLSKPVRHEINEKLWEYFEIENFTLKPVLSPDTSEILLNDKRPLLFLQYDGSFLFTGYVKSKIKKILQGGKLETTRIFFKDLRHEKFLCVAFFSFE